VAYKGYEFEKANDPFLRAVWEKGRIVQGHNKDVHRQDICGNWMQYDQHGKEGDYGWEVDHIKPLALKGSEDLSNLQPLQWRNNRRKADTYPWSG